MKRSLTNIARTALSNLGIGAVRTTALQELIQKASAFDTWNPLRDFTLMSGLTPQHAARFAEVVKRSKSQLRQDLFALCELGFKSGGWFVEFGATNGVDLSNTHLLEKEFGWRGVLAEPARCWHAHLAANRSAAIEKQCVWSTSGAVLQFNEVELAELSTIQSFSAADLHEQNRRVGKSYDVTTISLDDLLDKHNAPPVVDYLSIDTEGSELEILRNFAFGKRRFSVITCEHNHTPQREQIFALLAANGYVRKHEELSEFDDWYVWAGNR